MLYLVITFHDGDRIRDEQYYKSEDLQKIINLLIINNYFNVDPNEITWSIHNVDVNVEAEDYELLK